MRFNRLRLTVVTPSNRRTPAKKLIEFDASEIPSIEGEETFISHFFIYTQNDT